MTTGRKIMIVIPLAITLTATALLCVVYCKARYATAEKILNSDCLLTHTDEAASLVNSNRAAEIRGGELTFKKLDGTTGQERHTWLYQGRNIDRTNDAAEKEYKVFYSYSPSKNFIDTLKSLEIQEWHTSLLVSIPLNILNFQGSLKRHENA